MRKNRERRLDEHHIKAINSYLEGELGLKEKVIKKFEILWRAEEGTKTQPRKIIERMLCATDPGPAVKYKMETLWKATDLTKEEFERDVVQHKDFFDEHYKIQDSSTTDRPVLNRADQKKFIEFFGRAVENEDMHVHFVFPKRTLKSESSNPFDLENKKLSAEGGLPEGVSGWLAFEDVKSMMHLTNGITGITRKAVSIRHENIDPTDTNSCVIALGLAFNPATRRLEKSVKPRLFSIYVGPSPKRNSSVEKTDNFEFFNFESGKLKKVPINKGTDIALIVRIVPGKSAAPWFIAAGRTASGTAIAGYYLATHWRKLYDLYPNKKALSEKSVAVVIRHSEPDNQPVDIQVPTRLEKTAEMHYWDKDDTMPCIAWGDYE